MTYLLLGCRDKQRWAALSPSERNALEHACRTQDEVLRQRGHLLAGQDLQQSDSAIRVQLLDGALTLTDGPLVEAGEPIVAIFLIRARDLNEAIRIAAQMPQAQAGALVVQPMREVDPATPSETEPCHEKRKFD
jgi:hypothetical protein